MQRSAPSDESHEHAWRRSTWRRAGAAAIVFRPQVSFDRSKVRVRKRSMGSIRTGALTLRWHYLSFLGSLVVGTTGLLACSTDAPNDPAQAGAGSGAGSSAAGMDSGAEGGTSPTAGAASG